MIKEYAKKYLILLVGLFIMALGVAFSIKADLGTSPISSVPYVVSLIVPISVGNATIVMHCVFIALQILILRKRYHPIQLMQLPVALVFGVMTDACVTLLDGVSSSSYVGQWTLCVAGIVLVAIGFFAYGELLGVREGTVAAAILVGLLAKQLGKFYAKLAEIQKKKTPTPQP